MANWVYLLSSWVGFLYLSNRRRETGKFSSNLRYNQGRIFWYKKEGESSNQVISSQDSPFVMVDIKGAVQKPGVYQLPKDARVKDALAQAGGATKEADLRQLNLASKLQDEMAVYIPAAGEEIPPSSPVSSISSSGTSNDQPLVNINTANTDELQTLNGIGPSKASAIVSYREENGLFQTVEDLGKVSGIGEKSLEKIKAQITVQ